MARRGPHASWGPLTLLALVAACSPGLDQPEPERLGTALVPGGDGVKVAQWSADGTEIYYLAASLTGSMTLKAAKTDASGVRVLDATKAEYWSLFMPPDGSSLYYTAAEAAPDNGPVERHVYEAFQGKRADAVTLDMKADVVAASPDDHHLAVWSAGVVHEVDLVDGSSTDLTSGMPFLRETDGNSWELTYAPGGDKLMFLEGGGDSMFTGAIVDLATKAVDPHALVTGDFPAPIWKAAGLSVLSTTLTAPPAYQIEDVATGAVTSLAWSPPHGSAGPVVWSRDGTLVATLDSWCTSGDGFLNCNAGEDALYVVEVASSRASLVARSTSGIGAAEFSPDGRRIAYSAGAQLYVADVP